MDLNVMNYERQSIDENDLLILHGQGEDDETFNN